MVEPDWYRKNYDESYLRLYAPKLSVETAALEVDRIVERLDLAPGARVLDLACGQGRHALALAHRGFVVTGLDLSEFLLDQAKTQAARAGADVRFVRADMREIPFVAEFDAVISVFTSFGYLESEREDKRVLARIRRALVPEGRFLLETMHRDGLLPRLELHAEERRPDGSVVSHDRSFDLGTSRLEDRATLVAPDGGHFERSTSIRLYTLPELRGMCEEVGMRVDGWYGGFDGSPLTLASRRLALRATRVPDGAPSA